MAVFGAPITLEDHAVRACLATLGIQEESKRLAAEVHDRDTIDLRVRVGLSARGVAAGIRIHGPGGVPRRSNADDRRSSGGDPCQAQDGRAGRCAALVTVRHRPGRGRPCQRRFHNGLTVGHTVVCPIQSGPRRMATRPRQCRRHGTRNRSDNGWVIREPMLLRLCALSRSRRAISHDGHIAGLRRALGMGRGDEMNFCRALTPSTVPLDALETVLLTTTQGGPLWASSSG